MRTDVSLLTNQQLLQSLERWVQTGREVDAELLLHLGEVEARGIYREQATSSMWAYCTQRLGMSEDVTSIRLRAARAAREFPEVVEMIADGRMHLSGVALLAKHLTQENHEQVGKCARGLSKRDIEKRVVELAPKPDVRDRVRRTVSIGTDGVAQELPSAQDPPSCAPPLTSSVGPEGTQLTPAASRRSPPVTPRSPGRYKVTFTASEEVHEKLRRAQDLLRHAVPDGNLEEVMGRALALLVEDLERKKFGKLKKAQKQQTSQASQASTPSLASAATPQPPSPNAPLTPRKSTGPGPSDPGAVSRRVRREVSERDGYQCTFRDSLGRRCSSKTLLEFHHEAPRAQGGDGSADNVRLMCKTHNQLAAEHDYGAELMRQKRLGEPPTLAGPLR